ncbi:riboflavin synthase [Clostridium sardiniense]|uniref:Riboflavin synthase n=1 Tax=Clostridium sardiniense TaxID=29369 RepID=A0ABS7KYI5_CLOSR|nr:riboflavin synthase [Clostridium sardiniense]MBY0755879.1 riboflavin synthase [Clostridium sardiniense]MDQ0459890.1 riboflavin synthase [Clostridium sardiniense]
MFTGIIEEIGEIQSIKKGDKSSRLLIKANKVLKDTKIGDSISTNGVCLTVTSISSNSFEADVMAETLRKSNLGDLKKLNKVNLERALSIKSRLGGHIVSGHIDGVGKIVDFTKEDNAVWITIKAPTEILKYVVLKGSIAIDGVSLTVAYVDDEIFKVSIIPHTGEETILLNKKTGETVNLECDVIGKYVEKLLKLDDKKTEVKENTITEDFLKNNGFL